MAAQYEKEAALIETLCHEINLAELNSSNPQQQLVQLNKLSLQLEEARRQFSDDSPNLHNVGNLESRIDHIREQASDAIAPEPATLEGLPREKIESAAGKLEQLQAEFQNLLSSGNLASLENLQDNLESLSSGLGQINLPDNSPNAFQLDVAKRGADQLKQQMESYISQSVVDKRHELEAQSLTESQDENLHQVKSKKDELISLYNQAQLETNSNRKREKLEAVIEQSDDLLKQMKSTPNSRYLALVKEEIEVRQTSALMQLESLQITSKYAQEARWVEGLSSEMRAIADNLESVNTQDMGHCLNGLANIKDVKTQLNELKSKIEIGSPNHAILLNLENKIQTYQETIIDSFYPSVNKSIKEHRDNLYSYSEQKSIKSLSNCKILLNKVNDGKRLFDQMDIKPNTEERKRLHQECVDNFAVLVNDVQNEIMSHIDHLLPLLEENTKKLKEGVQQGKIISLTDVVDLNSAFYVNRSTDTYKNWDQRDRFEKAKDDLLQIQTSIINRPVSTSPRSTPIQKIDLALSNLMYLDQCAQSIKDLPAVAEERLQLLSEIRVKVGEIQRHLLGIKLPDNSPNSPNLQLAKDAVREQVLSLMGDELLCIAQMMQEAKERDIPRLKEQVRGLELRLGQIKAPPNSKITEKLQRLQTMAHVIDRSLVQLEEDITQPPMNQFVAEFMAPYLTGKKNPATEPQRAPLLDQIKDHFEKKIGWNDHIQELAVKAYVTESVKGLAQMVAKFEEDQAAGRHLRGETNKKATLPLVSLEADSKIFQDFLGKLEVSFAKEFPDIDPSNLRQMATSALEESNQQVVKASKLEADLGDVKG